MSGNKNRWGVMINDVKKEFKYRNERILSTPGMINLELTSGCNIKCRHCYNFWRDDSQGAIDKISEEEIDKIVEMVKEDGVFHVVLTGGEPFITFDVLEYSLKKFDEAGVSTSVNSNLMLATPENVRRLKAVGLDHVLTSLNSFLPEVNDYMAHRKGSFDQIIRGIKVTREAGIRVSSNMIISEPNQSQVYETAKLCSELGVQRIFGTRLVPSETVDDPTETDLKLDRDSALKVINDLIRAKEDFGIGIGTLIAYPLCMLGDLEKYRDFVGRGCPAQRGNRMIINANGETHACTHESYSYGNVFEVGIREAFKKMHEWHDGTYLFEGCNNCEYINVCGSGCRAAANSYFKKTDGMDPLFAGADQIKIPYKAKVPGDISKLIWKKEDFFVPKTIRFRKEDGFYSINIRWANSFTITSEVAEFLIKKQASGEPVSIDNMVGEDSENEMLKLIFKEALVPENIKLRNMVEADVKQGCSINPEDLPQAFV